MAERVLRPSRVLLALPRASAASASARLRERLQRLAASLLRAPACSRTRARASRAPARRPACVALPGIERVRLERVLRDPPAAAPRRRVEPARVVPAGDVRRIEELLPRHRVEPDPGGRVDPAADAPEEPRGVDDRRLDEPRPVEELRVHEDRLDDGPDRVPGRDVELLERARRPVVGRHRDEVAPELLDEERRVRRMADAEAARVLPREVAA